MSAVQLQATILQKIKGADLAKICEDAPEGTNADGDSYQDMCNACLDDSTRPGHYDTPQICAATLIASYVQEQGGTPAAGTPPAATPPAATPPAAGTNRAPALLTDCSDPSQNPAVCAAMR